MDDETELFVRVPFELLSPSPCTASPGRSRAVLSQQSCLRHITTCTAPFLSSSGALIRPAQRDSQRVTEVSIVGERIVPENEDAMCVLSLNTQKENINSNNSAAPLALNVNGDRWRPPNAPKDLLRRPKRFKCQTVETNATAEITPVGSAPSAAREDEGTVTTGFATPDEDKDQSAALTSSGISTAYCRGCALKGHKRDRDGYSVPLPPPLPHAPSAAKLADDTSRCHRGAIHAFVEKEEAAAAAWGGERRGSCGVFSRTNHFTAAAAAAYLLGERNGHRAAVLSLLNALG